jgi:3,4-dihydroxy 2-butanone 4-phosphate synthase
MYTGRIREVGAIIEYDRNGVVVAAPKTAGQLEIGGSVSVSGVCVTATEIQPGAFRAALSTETRRRSSLADREPGALVNLEVPLRVGDPLDGHLVQGHVDAVGKIVGVADEPVGRRAWIRPPRRFLDEVVPKGSIAVDGVSLTVAEVVRDRFSVALIPATLTDTTLASLTEGDRVNLEGDLVGRVARRWSAGATTALASVIGSLPWAGRLSGRVAVEKAVAQLATGGGVVVWDPEREGEGDVVFAGVELRPQAFVFLLTQACGHTTVPCAPEVLERLEIGPIEGPGDRHGTAPHTPVDLASSTGTGVSPAERAATVRRLARPDARPEDFLRPGHVFPLRARPGLLAERKGHTEAAVAMCVAAGVPPVAAICEIMTPDGVMAGEGELERFSLRWGLPMVAIDDLQAWL